MEHRSIICVGKSVDIIISISTCSSRTYHSVDVAFSLAKDTECA